jgi:hypothetical protein
VAVLRYAQPDSLLLLGSCRYARAEWFTAGRLGYVTRSNLLVAVDLDSLRTDTLQRNVEAFSVALGTGAYAVGFNGDSLAVFGADGARLGEAVSDAAVPQISPNGSRLAYHAEDYGVWILSLASGESREVGVGYPVRWSADGTLLLFFERQVDDRRVTHTIYHVAGAENGATATLPADGFIVDATFAR